MHPGGAHLIAALLLAHLAVPAELLQPLGLDAVGDGLGAEEIRLPHGARGPPPSPGTLPEVTAGSRRGAYRKSPSLGPARLRGAAALTFSGAWGGAAAILAPGAPAAAAVTATAAMLCRGAAVGLYQPAW